MIATVYWYVIEGGRPINPEPKYQQKQNTAVLRTSIPGECLHQTVTAKRPVSVQARVRVDRAQTDTHPDTQAYRRGGSVTALLDAHHKTVTTYVRKCEYRLSLHHMNT